MWQTAGGVKQPPGFRSDRRPGPAVDLRRPAPVHALPACLTGTRRVLETGPGQAIGCEGCSRQGRQGRHRHTILCRVAKSPQAVPTL